MRGGESLCMHYPDAGLNFLLFSDATATAIGSISLAVPRVLSGAVAAVIARMPVPTPMSTKR